MLHFKFMVPPATSSNDFEIWCSRMDGRTKMIWGYKVAWKFLDPEFKSWLQLLMESTLEGLTRISTLRPSNGNSFILKKRFGGFPDYLFPLKDNAGLKIFPVPFGGKSQWRSLLPSTSSGCYWSLKLSIMMWSYPWLKVFWIVCWVSYLAFSRQINLAPVHSKVEIWDLVRLAWLFKSSKW